MNVIQLMEQKKSEFTKNHMLIYNKISEDPGKYAQMTTSELAEVCGVSQPALTRFVKDLGYSKYRDFRSDLTAWLAEQRAMQTSGEDRLQYFSVMNQLMTETEKLLTDSYMKELASYVKGFQRVFATGVAKSYQPASLMQTLMIKTDRFVQAISNDSLPELCDAVDETDLIIVFSVSAKKSVLHSLEGIPAKILLITANPAHSFGDVVDRQVLLPYVPPTPEESSVSPVLFDMFVEILCRYLQK